MVALPAPGGAAIVQISNDPAGYRFRASDYLAHLPVRGTVGIHVRPRAAVF